MTNMVHWKSKERWDLETEMQFQTRGCATLPKTSGTTCTSPCSSRTLPLTVDHYLTTPESKRKNRTLSLGFQEPFKTRTSVFGNFIHLKKNKRKSDSTICFHPHMNNNDTEISNNNGKLSAISEEEIVRLLTPSKSYYPDLQTIFAVLLCCRLYTCPIQLLEQIHNAVMIELSLSTEDDLVILKRLAQLLNEWTITFPSDFEEKSDYEQLIKICNFITTNRPDLKIEVDIITKNQKSYLETKNDYITRNCLDEIEFDEVYLLMDICNDPIIVAEQLTIIELDKLSKVSLEELIINFASSKLKKSVKKSTKKCPKKIKSMTEIYADWFNRLSHLVATEICMCPKLEERAKIINFFIEVGKQCFKISNFNSLMAILTGLNKSSVSRMRRTWSHSNRSVFLKLEKELSPINNFARYRETLKLRKSSKDLHDYIVPIFALLLKDLTFINEGFKTILPNNLINFEKFMNFATEVREILEAKTMNCKYQKENRITEYLLRSPLCNEEGLYKSSFEVEPPDSSFERDRYRSVKMKIKSI
ncbi:ras-GEF domain-containing family member 1C [Hydra vulgaris]|nr:ras-GEF domain-containing family member 1C [Hydra vulgaris]